jgi:hypothetical protein
MIRGYAEQPSPRAGQSLTLRVATDAQRFRVDVHRCGQTLELVHRTGWLRGTDAPLHLPWHDWGRLNIGLRGEPLAPWPAHTLDVGRDWPPGVYVAVLVEEGDERPPPVTADARHGAALFVVRSAPDAPRRAPILYKLPLLTYHAYDLAGGEPYDTTAQTGQWCFYNVPRAREVPIPFPAGLGLHRPGGGTGATPYDVFNIDPFDPTPRQTYAHWDAKFVAWLERAGYEVEYCTDVDLHREGAALLAPHRLLVSAGHDEYWSDAMRAAVDEHVAGGGNVAFFSGNTCWWRVAFPDDVTFERLHWWYDPDTPGEPENTMVGVSFRNGGERDRDDFPVPVGYRVQHADHWVYAGSGLGDGDVFGERDCIVGYECDGAAFDRADLEAGRMAEPTGDDGTPKDFTILAVGDCRPSGWGFGNGAATMGLFTQPAGGTVFTASTTDWARVLAAGDPVVGRITANVLDRLGASPPASPRHDHPDITTPDMTTRT